MGTYQEDEWRRLVQRGLFADYAAMNAERTQEDDAYDAIARARAALIVTERLDPEETA